MLDVYTILLLFLLCSALTVLMYQLVSRKHKKYGQVDTENLLLFIVITLITIALLLVLLGFVELQDIEFIIDVSLVTIIIFKLSRLFKHKS